MATPFRGLARFLSPQTPLAMTPAARSQLVQQLMAQSQSPQGIVSPYGTANKALQGLLVRRANNQEQREAAAAKESLSKALGIPEPTNIVLDDVMGGPSETRTIQPAMLPEQKRMAALLSGLPQQGVQAAQMALLQKAIAPEGAESYTLGQGEVRYGPDNRQVASNPKPIIATEDIPQMVNEISDDLYRESQTFNVQLANIGNVRQSLADPSPAGDMGLIYSYMKMLDPTSAVREAEYATAENARGVPATVRNIWNRLQDGQRLDEDQRRDFSNRAERYFAQERANQSRRNDRFLNRAVSAGIPKEMFTELLLPLDPSQIQGREQPAPQPQPPPIPIPTTPPTRVIR